MKKILFVINNMKIGGIQKSLINLLSEINDLYDISLIVFSPDGCLMKYLPSNIKIVPVNPLLQVLGINQKESYGKGLKILSLQTFCAIFTRVFGNGWIINLLVKIGSIKETFDYAISYAQFFPAKYFVGGTNEYVLNCVKANSKIAFVHSDFENYGGNNKYTRSKYKEFDKIAFCSNSVRDGFLKIMPELKNKTYVVKNFNAYEKIRTLSFKETIKYSKDFYNLISISRLSEEKGIDKAIKAVAYCLGKGLKINYHIVGDGPDKILLQRLTQKFAIEKHVFFYGETENPYKFLPNADLLLFPSIHEAAGLVIEEAASLGVPVLASETISSQEMVLDNDFGWVCENNQEKFNLFLESLLVNSEKIIHKKEAIRKQNFNNALNLKQFKILLDDY